MTSAIKENARMTADSFIAWSEAQPARHEMIDGIVVAMGSEQATHARVKTAVLRELDRRIAGLPCEAFGDGMAVRVDEETVFEPDAMVRCGPRLPGETVLVVDPMIVVEVASPSIQRIDALRKFARYFRNASIMHYLIVVPRHRLVIHHARTGDGLIVSASHDKGVIKLDPPGLELALEAFFATLVDGDG